MDLEFALYPVVEGLAPHALPDSAISNLCRDLGRLLASPARSPSQLQTILDVYKMQVQYSPENLLRWQKLQNVMQLLFGIEKYEEMVKYLSAFQSMLVDNLSAKPTNNGSLNDISVNMGGLETQDNLLSPLRPLSLQAESYENLDRFSDRRSLVSSPRGHTSHNLVTLNALADPYYSKMVSEDEILKFVSYSLLATTSDLFPVEFNKIKIPNNVPNTESGMLHLIFEAALLYQNLRWKVDQYRNSDVSPMKKALIIHVEKVLRNYTGFINSLSAKILSLKSLYYELYDYIITLRFFNGFISDFATTSGDSYLIQSSSLINHGDLLVRRICSEISKNLLSLYFEYLVNWLTLSTLEGTYGEFFISEAQTTDLIPVQLDESKIPDFIPKSIAYEILMIGKTYIFLVKYCKELQWTNDMSKKYHGRYKEIEFKQISTEFYNIVHEQNEEIVKFSYEILLKKFYFKEVVFALKDILLMGKSDLIDLLIRRASHALSAPSASLSSYMLTRYLQEAVQHSSLRNLLNLADCNYIINGLDARVLDLGHGSIGWDVFTLDYLIDAPLSIVLNVNRRDGKKEYLRIFNFLWRFKKNNHFSNDEWLRTNQLVRDFKKLSKHSPLVRDLLAKLSRLDILRAQLQQFSLKVEAYCFRSIIDENFHVFERKLMLTSQESNPPKYPTVRLKSGVLMLDGILKPEKDIFNNETGNLHNVRQRKLFNIDELDRIHNEYLNTILSNKLLASGDSKSIGAYSGQPYPTSLILMLNSVFEFITVYSTLNDVAHEILIQMNLQSQHQQLNNLLERFNSVLSTLVAHYKRFRESSFIFIKDLKLDGDEDLAKLGRILR